MMLAIILYLGVFGPPILGLSCMLIMALRTEERS